MSQLVLRDSLWRHLEFAARKKGKSPEVLAAAAIQEYLQRLADEELLERSARLAQRNGLTVAEIETRIKQRRRQAMV